MLQYRRDIDGLRAVAVLGVVLFHAFPKALPGGFIGVDVFFVISGYLISGVLIDRCDRGRFSILDFYERRVRRIIPALAVMLAVVTAVATLFLPPADLRAYSSALVSVALFSSNILFWLKGGYFDGPAQEKPLLHTWSLSVEEQFYILWPFVIWLICSRFGRRRAGLWIALLTVVSLAVSEAMMRWDRNAAFYLIPSRAWELSIGALLATGRLPVPATRATRDGLSGLGLALVVGGMILLDETVRFPGVTALIPCVGAALMIHANARGDTAVAKLLSQPWAVGIGLISYSLYLWHWPALVLPPLILARDLAPAEILGAVAAAFGLGWLSWRYVERPFRAGPTAGARRLGPLTAAAVVLVLAGGAGLTLRAVKGAPQRAPDGVLQAELVSETINPLRPHCHVLDGTGRAPPIAGCVAGGEGGGEPRVLVWGDSHADHVFPGVAAWGAGRGLPVRQATKSGCRPLLADGGSPFATAECLAFDADVLRQARAEPGLRYVVISGRWTSMLAGDQRDPAAREAAAYAALDATLTRTRRDLGPGVRLVLVGSTPEFSFLPSKCLARARFMRIDTRHCELAKAENFAQAQAADRILTRLAAAHPGVAVTLPWSKFCVRDLCRTTRGATILYRDDDHLSLDGARLVMSDLNTVLRDQGV
ncbi:MAG: acyltransferase 3 [Caulobacter sp.]|nr:acyltransferase 3 [Caulobacter sp.]